MKQRCDLKNTTREKNKSILEKRNRLKVFQRKISRRKDKEEEDKKKKTQEKQEN